MHSQPRPGDTHTLHQSVRPRDVIRLGEDGDTGVFATPAMIWLMELAAKALLQPHLESGEESVGATVNITHSAPTPPDAEVSATATVIKVDGNRIDFEVIAHDEIGPIGEGTHQRAVIPMSGFRKAMAKRHAEPEPGSWGDRVLLDEAEGIARVTLNRPAKRNAIDTPMTRELTALLAYLRERSDLQGVILKGAGGHFSAGEDIVENAPWDADTSTAMARRRADVCRALLGLPAPVVAVVEGSCLGGGFMLALHADAILAAPDASFGLPEILLGWPPAYGLERTRERLGTSATAQLALSGRPVTAHRARDAGWVGQVCPPPLLESSALRQLSLLNGGPALARTATRKLLLAQRLEDNLEAYRECRGHPDAWEGIRAFREKK